jgi:hypothetical protein
VNGPVGRANAPWRGLVAELREVGEALDIAFRLLDAPRVKMTLKTAQDPRPARCLRRRSQPDRVLLPQRNRPHGLPPRHSSGRRPRATRAESTFPHKPPKSKHIVILPTPLAKVVGARGQRRKITACSAPQRLHCRRRSA